MENFQKEKIIEHLISSINTGAGGRLVIFKPEKEKGIDLEVQKRGDYKTKPVRFMVASLEKQSGQFSGKLEAGEGEDLFCILAYFDTVTQKIEATWFMSAGKYKKLFPGGNIVISPMDTAFEPLFTTPEALGEKLLDAI